MFTFVCPYASLDENSEIEKTISKKASVNYPPRDSNLSCRQ